MSATIELVPMFCLRCQNAIPAAPDEAAWVCGQCGQGMRLSDEGGLVPLEFHFSDSIPAGARGKPFWVAEGKVDIHRSTFSGDRTREMLDFWQAPRNFFIPAFELPIEDVTRLGISMLLQPPSINPGSPVGFEAVTIPLNDVRPLSEFIILSIEAGRKDDLKAIEFQLQLEEAQLWVLP